MKKSALFAIIIMVFPFEIDGVSPVHLGKVSIDTSMYDFSQRNYGIEYLPGPFTSWKFNPSPTGLYDLRSSSMLVQAFKKKNSNQFDFYSFSGKIGTSTIPILADNNVYINQICFSRDMVDDDAGWETIVNYYNNGYYFKVFDDNGTELLADSGTAYYGSDGNSTYVLTLQSKSGYYDIDTWRFRTNITSNSPTLSKSQAVSPGLMQIYGQDNGNYRVTLSPSSGNQIKLQLFDLLGRCIFSKQINNITSAQTFTIPEANVPKSPFVAKVTDGKGSVYKKEIPVN